MNPKLDLLKASLSAAPITKFGDYQYFVHPITDGVPPGTPELFEEVVEAIWSIGNFDCDKIITPESMGFPLAAALALRARKPYLFIRKRRYNLPGELSLRQVTGYSGNDMFINCVEKGDRLVFVDDVVSTGGTLRAIVKALRSQGATIVDCIIVFEKTTKKAELEEELGLKIKTLLRVTVQDGKLYSLG